MDASGNISTTGHISATAYYGDGSALTGISANTDRIVSGSTNIIANTTGSISFTTAGTTAMVISGSNVGIGTTAPATVLQVNGSLNSTDTLTLRANTNNGSNRPGIVFVNTNPSPLLRIGSGSTDGESWINALGGLHFGTNSGVYGANERMTITTGGNVGIGTTAPAATLQVSGSFIVSTTGQNTTPTLYVGTNGRVAVGTNSADSLLHLEGKDANIGITLNDSANGYIPFIAFKQADSVKGMIRAGTGLVNRMDFSVNGTADILTLKTNTVGIGTTTPAATLQVSGSFIVSTSAQTTTPSLYVGTDGYVGIGTTSPAKTLHVSGTTHIASTTTVSGTIHATEIKVSNAEQPCNAASVGTLRWNAAKRRPEMCFPDTP